MNCTCDSFFVFPYYRSRKKEKRMWKINISLYISLVVFVYSIHCHSKKIIVKVNSTVVFLRQLIITMSGRNNTTVSSMKNKTKEKQSSRSGRAGLTFPVGRVVSFPCLSNHDSNNKMNLYLASFSQARKLCRTNW